MREIISSLDIGSSKIKLVVAEVLDEKINVLCAIDEPSRGVVHGAIVESSDLEYAIKRLLKKAENMLSIEIKKVIVSVCEETCEFKIGEASIKLGEEDEYITASDVTHVLQASVKGQIDPHSDLVTVMPIMYKIDDKKTKVPKKQKGESLSVKSVVISVTKKDIYLIAKVLEKCGVEIVDIMTCSLGAYFAHNNESTDTSTGIIIDCGAENFKISVFNKGVMINNLVLNVGGNDIDKDIAYIYKIKEADAKKLKEKFGYASKKNLTSKEVETVTNVNGEKIEISQIELATVINSRLIEMLNMSKNEINYLTKKEISYIIITGGLTELRDFELACESVFSTIARVGKIQIVGIRDNKYASCLGMIKYFDNKLKLREKEFTVFSDEDLETLSSKVSKKNISGESIISKVFGMFFDNKEE